MTDSPEQRAMSWRGVQAELQAKWRLVKQVNNRDTDLYNINLRIKVLEFRKKTEKLLMMTAYYWFAVKPEQVVVGGEPQQESPVQTTNVVQEAPQEPTQTEATPLEQATQVEKDERDRLIEMQRQELEELHAKSKPSSCTNTACCQSVKQN